MSEALERLGAAIAARTPTDGVAAGAVAGTWCVRRSSPTPLENRRWRAALAFVASGEKELVVGARSHALRPGTWTLTLVPLPVLSRFVGATPRAPFLALLVDVDPGAVARVVAEMDPAEAHEGPVRGVFVGEVTPDMQSGLARLAEASASAEAARVLGPGLRRELLYAALRGPDGPEIRRFARADGDAYGVARAVHRIEAELDGELDVSGLARAVGMSRTAFFEAFKRVTSTTPAQYRKRLRLIEARRLMVQEHATAESACFSVGYRSPAQFSRDFVGLFGEPPAAHARRLREARGGSRHA